MGAVCITIFSITFRHESEIPMTEMASPREETHARPHLCHPDNQLRATEIKKLMWTKLRRK